VVLGARCVAAEATPPDAALVPVVRPQVKALVEYDEYTGRFDAIRRVEVRARVSGYVDRVEFREGQLVEAGDLLAVIDQRPFRVVLAAAEAARAEAQALYDLAQIQSRRAEQLIRRQAIAQDELDIRVQEAAAAAARVASAEAQIAEAKLNLEFTQVRAPIAGRVGERLVDEGNLVGGEGSPSTLLTTIVQEDPIYFVFEVSEADYLKYVRLDQRGDRPISRNTPNAVSVRLLDEPGFVHHGVMDFVDNELDASSGTLRGRAVLANPDRLLQPGLFGRMRLQGSGLHDAVLVPDHVIQFDQSRQFVLIIDSEGKAQRVWVEPGPMVDDLRIIRSGLTGDETVIAGAFHRVRIGNAVQVRPPGALVTSD
jgi:RND family efflux transporter MFP subunit